MSSNNNQIERRMLADNQVSASDPTKLVGYAAKYNVVTDLGEFLECISLGAFDSAIARGDDTRFLVDHDSSQLLGRTRSGTLSLQSDSTGLKFAVNLPRTQLASDVAELIRRKDLSGCSFSFALRPGDDEFSVDRATGKPLRTINNFSLLVDCSVVCWPQYSDTSIAARASIPEAVLVEARSIASRTGAVSEAERLKLLDRAYRQRLSWVTREIAKDDAADDDPDPDSDDAFDLEDDFRCQRCGSRSFRCLGCGTIGGGEQK